MSERPRSATKGGIFLSCVDETFYSNELILQRNTFLRMISGEMKIVLPEQTILLRTGDTMLFPKNLLTRVIKYPKNGLPYKSVAIFFTEESLQKYYLSNQINTEIPQNRPDIYSFPKHFLLDSLFNSLLPYFDSDNGLPENISGIKINEAISILRSIDPSVDIVLGNFSAPEKVNLIEFMEKNFMFNLSLERFSYLTGRSLTGFKRDFNKAFHMPPQRWLQQRRLELAYHQISEKGKKPVEVCYEVGFENLSHFSYSFKKHFGISPSALLDRNQLASLE
jgi:AraC family transcriptional regulator, exoenzyme S synthesis regulatory protein ExsA